MIFPALFLCLSTFCSSARCRPLQESYGSRFDINGTSSQLLAATVVLGSATLILDQPVRYFCFDVASLLPLRISANRIDRFVGASVNFRTECLRVDDQMITITAAGPTTAAQQRWAPFLFKNVFYGPIAPTNSTTRPTPFRDPLVEDPYWGIVVPLAILGLIASITLIVLGVTA